MTEPMKTPDTPQEILIKKFGGSIEPWMIQAMHSYADQERLAERERIKKKVGKLKDVILPDELSSSYYGAAINKVLKLIDSL